MRQVNRGTVQNTQVETLTLTLINRSAALQQPSILVDINKKSGDSFVSESINYRMPTLMSRLRLRYATYVAFKEYGKASLWMNFTAAPHQVIQRVMDLQGHNKTITNEKILLLI